MTDISYGVTYPAGQQEHSQLSDYVTRVEALGYHSMWLIENIGPNTPGLECLTTLGYMAACSTRLVIGTSVLLLPMRNPVLVAQGFSSLDVLSEGRVVLGIGVGDSPSHDAVGSDRRTRGARCEEAIALVRKLWSEDTVTFSGRFNSISNYTLGPRPVQSPHPPIWVGGHSDAAVERAARHADGFIPVGATPQACKELFDRLDSKAKSLNRKPDKLTRAVHAYLGIDDTPEAAVDTASRVLTKRFGRPTRAGDPNAHLLGSIADCRRSVQAFLDIGVTHFILDPVCNEDETIEQVELCAQKIIGSGG